MRAAGVTVARPESGQATVSAPIQVSEAKLSLGRLKQQIPTILN